MARREPGVSVKAVGDYDFPSADRIENFGPDQLVYVLWEGNPLFCAAAAFRVPRAMPFGEFVATMVHPWAASDPDFDPAAISGWKLFDAPVDPAPGTSLEDLGIRHKALLRFTADDEPPRR
jgi:phenol/toluene 2-monooxygenase (NADH) P4/A4